jgi:hypothetical protein
VAWGLALLGLDPTFPASARVVASAILGVPGLVLEAAAREAGAATGYRGRGRAITTVLAEVPAPALHRVLAAGHAADLWGEPIVDDGRALRSLAFPGAARGPPQGET